MARPGLIVVCQRSLLLGFLALGVVPLMVAAQQPTDVTSGATIRVSSVYLGEGWLRGRLESAKSNTLVVRLDRRRPGPMLVILSWSAGDSLFAAQTDSATAPFTDPALRLQLSTAQRRDVERGLLIGVCVGVVLGVAAAGVLAAAQEGGGDTGEEICTFTECARIFGPVGGLAGLAIGGASVRHDWTDVSPATIRIGRRRVPGEIRLVFGVSF